MPRIRTFKPECRQHRKVGALSDRDFRLWFGMVLEADDEGRLVANSEQLRVLIWGYHPSVTVEDVENSLQALARQGLVRLYFARGVRYCVFTSWHDHQRINRPSPSKLPPPKQKLKSKFSEDSLSAHGGLTGDRKGTERKGSDLPVSERSVSPEREPRTLEAPVQPGTPRSAHALRNDGNQDPEHRKMIQAILEARGRNELSEAEARTKLAELGVLA